MADRISPVKPPSRSAFTMANFSALLLSSARVLFAMLLAVLSAPLLAPAILLLLPDCKFVRVLEDVSARIVTTISIIAGVNWRAGPKHDIRGYRSMRWAWLFPPTIRQWSSPLPSSSENNYVVTYDQPGRWMSDAQLATLSNTLYYVAENSMDTVPQHRLFGRNNLREVFSNRIVSVAYSALNVPLGFTAVVYLPYEDSFVVHLGLTMIAHSARGKRLQSPLFSKCLSLIAINHCTLSYTITNIAASPAGIGAVADYFVDTFPHYLHNQTALNSHHVKVARHVLRYFRHEFGCSTRAKFDENTFVVHASNELEGGGAAAFIKEDGKPVSRHKNPACNSFVLNHLDLTAGDELFQVGHVNVFVSIMRFVRRKKIKNGNSAKMGANVAKL